MNPRTRGDEAVGDAAPAPVTQTNSRGETFTIVRPGIIATYYLAGPVPAASKAIADSIPRYLDLIGPDSIRGYVAQNGTYKSFNTKRLDRDLKVLRSAPANEQGPDLDYSSELTGSVGDYGIVVRGGMNDEKLSPLSVSFVRYEFPRGFVTSMGIDAFAEFAIGEAVQLGVQSATVGWGFRRAEPFATEARAAVNALLPRYLGFDPCFWGFGLKMRGHSPPANWITMIDAGLVTACGGVKRLKAQAPLVRQETRKKLTILRAAQVPPLGDRNRGAKDLGALPELARFLAPARVEIAGFGDTTFDTNSWLARFDELPSASYANAPDSA